ncbi:MAG: DUF3365 domain-containing protein [Proteobacteria bacterium]|uniref:DUF3365 domain-containing protein n=1 Tax=Aquabacterium sp. TaxID=1872578 RepID=UPI0035C76B16|nr:DUF3365 domain-containing protein [Pseudomonadota bacterium]
MVEHKDAWGRSALMAALVALLVGSIGAAAWWTSDALLMSRSVNEGRVVADMAETVGRWASQYGGVHARTQGASAALPGAFLTRAVYAGSDEDAALLQGARTGTGLGAGSGMESRQEERHAMARVESYYWKNPALVQREVADVLLASGSRAQYRLTARSVLNRGNAPNGFEIEALDALQAAFQRQGASASPAVAAVLRPLGSPPSPAQGKEYWKVEGGHLLYARAVMAQASCLRCHDSPQKAPEFLRTNQQFNGGGGFGYQVGQPVGLISVKLPVATSASLLRDGVPRPAWLALAVAVLAGVGIVWLGVSRGAQAVRRVA